MHYCIADIHGDFEKYQAVLRKIRFCDKDVLYVLGDVIDRGSNGLKVLFDMMMRPNVYPILGNHEYMAAQCMQWLMNEVTEESISSMNEDMMQSMTEWLNIGGQATLTAFRELDSEHQEMIVEYLSDFELYEEVEVNDQSFVLVHAGIRNFEPDKELDEYDLYELIFEKPDYFSTYFPNRFLVTGHTPTRFIYEEALALQNAAKDGEPSPYDKVYKEHNHIAIDCGCGFGGHLCALCLETMEEIYV